MSESGPTVVCSILEPTGRRTRVRLDEVPAGCGLVEIRGDHLTRQDLLEAVRAARQPVIVTVRRAEDGGFFSGSEEERIASLRAACEAGARFIDVELASPAERLGAGDLRNRVILSHHGSDCRESELVELHRVMRGRPCARIKIVPVASQPAQIGAVRALLARTGGDSVPVACFAMGRAGALSRLLAISWGSWGTYGAAAAGAETAPGQFAAEDLVSTYDVTALGPATRHFALIGSRVFASPSPAMHAAGYRELGLDARYFPLEIDELEQVAPLVGPRATAGIRGLAVTMPFKERAAAICESLDPVSRAAGAVNTVLCDTERWSGFNTDGPAAVRLVRRHLDPQGSPVAIVGAGGTAAAAAVALRAAGARVTLFNRTADRARDLAGRIGVDWQPLKDLPHAEWAVLVHATPAGRAGEQVLDESALRGRLVLDAVYGTTTPLIDSARRAGLVAIDGFELLLAQAVLQFERLTGRSPDPEILRRAGSRWLAARA